MTNFSVTIDKLTRWNVRDHETGLTKRFWSKQDVENYLDMQENVHAKTKSGNVQAQKRATKQSPTTKTKTKKKWFIILKSPCFIGRWYLYWVFTTTINHWEKNMDSQEWAAEFPYIPVSLAKKIVKSHGFDDVAEGFDNDLGCSFDEEGYEMICEIDENYEVLTQQLVDWLGY